jgi:hypothetical protein
MVSFESYLLPTWSRHLGYRNNRRASTNHTNRINWVYEATFLDNNKTNQAITYIDGLSKTRQSQIRIASQNTILGAETAYSEEGGNPIESMTAPTGTATFGYATRFFDVKSGNNFSDFTTANFDRDVKGAAFNTPLTPSRVDTSYGVGNYYRNASTLESHVDHAKGLPYSYAVNQRSPQQALPDRRSRGDLPY